MNKTTSTWKLHNNDLHIENCYYCMIDSKNKDVNFSGQNLLIFEARRQDLMMRPIRRAAEKLKND